MVSRLRTGRKTAKVSVLVVFALSLLTSPTWAQGGGVTGTVVDVDGDPLPGVQVSLLNEDGSSTGMVATSDADGAYSITGVAAGTYMATADLDGFQPASQAVEISAGVELTVAFELSPLFHKELIVSAQKVDENILDVPMTITAFDTEMMERLQVQTVVDLQELTPGLQFGDEMDQQGHGTVIRGIGSKDQEAHQDRAVATYVDGAYTLGTYGTAPGGGFDLERVEVARGPQGTLHGRNSIAGSINLVNTKPTDRWDATLMGEYTDWNRARFNAAIGGPLGGAFSFRLTGGTYQGDGIQENIGFGGDHDAPDQKFWAPQLRVRTSRFDMNMRWSHVEDTGTTRSLVQLANFNTTDPYEFDPITGEPIEWLFNPFYLYATPNPAVDPNCPPGVPGWHCGDLENKIASNFPGYSSSESDLATLYAQYQISDSLSVRYNFSYSDVLSFNTKDSDYTNRVSIEGDHTVASDGGLVGNEAWYNHYYDLPFEYEEMSHELQFTSSYSGPFNFIGGLFYYDMEDLWNIEKYHLNSTFRFLNADEAARAASPIWDFWPAESCYDVLLMIEYFGWGTPDPARAHEFEGLIVECPEGEDHTKALGWYTSSTMETRAAFFSGNYQFSDHWTLSGGLRYTEDEKFQPIEGVNGYSTGDFVGVPVTWLFASGEGAGRPVTWSKPIGHLAAEYRTASGNLIYGRISTGFRAGGFNITEVPGQVPPFIEEETLVNYELGGKGLFFNSRLQLTAGVWYNDFDNYQLTATQQAPPDIPPSMWSTSPLVWYTTNIQGTKIWGLDLEASWWLTNRFSLMGFYAYQDSEVGPHESVAFGDPDAEFGEWEHIDFETGETVTSAYELPTDMGGNSLPMQPKNKLALTAGYNIPLGASGGFQLLATYSYTGEMYNDIANLAIYEIPSHDRWDASVTWTPRGDNWAVTLFGKNLFDEIGVVEFQISGLGHTPPLGYLTNPREIGLQLYWRPFR